MRPLLRPPRLRPGDRVAVVAPSGPVVPERLDAGLDILRGWDLDPVPLPHVRAVHPALPHLAGTDQQRAADLQQALCEPGFRAVFTARGGYGAQRTVDLVDWAAVAAAAPRHLIGFSDVTVVHDALARHARVVSLYGPALAGEVFLKDEPTREHLRRLLFDETAASCPAAPGARTLVSGRATGVALGGCLTMLATNLATPHARPGARGGILLLEDVAEAPYAVDRSLTHLLRSGWLDGVAGVVLGSWRDCGPGYAALRPVLLERLAPLGVPVVEEFGFGHGSTALTVPLGVRAELDADARTLRWDL
ncbi:LD-carboxypeptidase [Streptomyces sp. NPDC059740]|uniref:S66 peptidase family protein n=1 Tax=Streptomyces sp. NPDC059740 TaxID=3346926 RepID=UPI0036555ED2